MDNFIEKGIKGFQKGHKVPKTIRKKLRKNHNPKSDLNLTRNFWKDKKRGYNWANGKSFTKEHKEKIRKSNIGKHTKEKNHFWKGGVTPINQRLRESSMYKIWRELVFLRDNFTCQNPNCIFCGNKQGGELHPHHIKSFSEYPKLRFNVDNGITLCGDFHRSIRWKENQYEKILMEMLK